MKTEYNYTQTVKELFKRYRTDHLRDICEWYVKHNYAKDTLIIDWEMVVNKFDKELHIISENKPTHIYSSHNIPLLYVVRCFEENSDKEDVCSIRTSWKQ